jgi:RNA polymerase sigma factor (sigma-70 family)
MQDAITQLTDCLPRLRRYARALVGERSSADDLVQDTMERGWTRLSSWQSNSDMRAWLFGIMHNLYIDQFRKKSLPTETIDENTPTQSVEGSQTIGLEIRDMEAALRLLPPDQREILLLVGLEEMTYDEIASNLRIPVGTVMSRLYRARERLRAVMEGRNFASSLKVVK